MESSDEKDPEIRHLSLYLTANEKQCAQRVFYLSEKSFFGGLMLFLPQPLPCARWVRVSSAELQEPAPTPAACGSPGLQVWVLQKWSLLAGVRMFLTALRSLEGVDVAAHTFFPERTQTRNSASAHATFKAKCF